MVLIRNKTQEADNKESQNEARAQYCTLKRDSKFYK